MLVVRASDELLGERVGGAVVGRFAERGVELRRPVRGARAPDDDSVERARDAYHALHPDEARALLEAWMVRAEASGGGALSREGWIDGLLGLALARLALGDADGAGTALDRALVVDPRLVLDPARYPPTLRDRLEARRAVPRPTATLRIDSDPSGARVRIDGRPVGDAPLRLEVPVGPHLVRVSIPGHRPKGRTVVVPSDGASVILRPALDPQLALLEAGLPGAPLPRATRAAAQASGERLWVLDVLADGSALRAQLREEGSERRAAAGPLGSPDALAQALSIAWDAASEAPAASSDPWPWVGAGIGAALLAGAAVAIAAAVSAQPAGFSAVGTIDRGTSAPGTVDP